MSRLKDLHFLFPRKGTGQEVGRSGFGVSLSEALDLFCLTHGGKQDSSKKLTGN